ncbi:hypothetical protein AVEN_61556-1 [Araneus ventricosus]|uniref:Uncharacterized protein n=1 Tax=Araneus ventricosus TaxID=182803 RepID=A0A4Y2MJ18_ARAVE|nr:hypothetical protein AVEN_61556-1 [Araneus ventricosus]
MDLSTTTHVFFWRDTVRRPFEQRYDGPYIVLSRTDKIFTLDVRGQKQTVSVDRFKPAYILGNIMEHEDAPSHMAPRYVTRSVRTVRFRLDHTVVSLPIFNLERRVAISITSHYETRPASISLEAAETLVLQLLLRFRTIHNVFCSSEKRI